MRYIDIKKINAYIYRRYKMTTLYKCKVCEEEKPYEKMCKYGFKGEQRARKICNPCEKETSGKERQLRYYEKNKDLCLNRNKEYKIKRKIIKTGKLPEDFEDFKIIKFDPLPHLREDEEEEEEK